MREGSVVLTLVGCWANQEPPPYHLTMRPSSVANLVPCGYIQHCPGLAPNASENVGVVYRPPALLNYGAALEE